MVPHERRRDHAQCLPPTTPVIPRKADTRTSASAPNTGMSQEPVEEPYVGDARSRPPTWVVPEYRKDLKRREMSQRRYRYFRKKRQRDEGKKRSGRCGDTDRQETDSEQHKSGFTSDLVDFVSRRDHLLPRRRGLFSRREWRGMRHGGKLQHE